MPSCLSSSSLTFRFFFKGVPKQRTGDGRGVAARLCAGIERAAAGGEGAVRSRRRLRQRPLAHRRGDAQGVVCVK